MMTLSPAALLSFVGTKWQSWMTDEIVKYKSNIGCGKKTLGKLSKCKTV